MPGSLFFSFSTRTNGQGMLPVKAHVIISYGEKAWRFAAGIYDRHPYLVLVSLFFISRWFVVLFCAGYGVTGTSEERIFTTWALERIRGNPMVQQNLFNEFLYGGAWIESYLYIPIIKIFGCHRVAMKLLPILFSTVGFTLYLMVGIRYFGKRTGLIFGMIAMLGTPLFLVYQISGLSNHNELIVFSGAGFLFLFWSLFGKKPNLLVAINFWFFAWLITGLGIFYNYTHMAFALYLALCLPFLLLRAFMRHGIWAALLPAAGLIGFLNGYHAIDWLRERSVHKFFGFYGATSNAGDSASMVSNRLGDSLEPEKLLHFFGMMVPRHGCFPNDFLDYAYFALTAIAIFAAFFLVIRSVVSAVKDKEGIWRLVNRIYQPDILGVFLLGCLTLMFLLVLNTAMDQWDSAYREHLMILYEKMHYFLPMLPALFLLMGVSLGLLFEHSGRIKAGAAVLTAGILALGLVSITEVTGDYGLVMGKSCGDYLEFTASNVFAINVQKYDEEKTCEEISAHALAMDPAQADQICQAIHIVNKECPCPYEESETNSKPPPVQETDP